MIADGDARKRFLALPQLKGSLDGFTSQSRPLHEGKPTKMATLTDTWHFTYLDCWTMETWTLPNGVTIPLPPRKKYWPDRGAKITVSRFADYEKKTAWYNMTIMPIGHDFVTARNFLIGQGAESAAGKIGALMFSKVPRAAAGIVLGPVACGVLAGLATVLVPSQVATEKFWNGSCSEGPVHVVVTGWNV